MFFLCAAGLIRAEDAPVKFDGKWVLEKSSPSFKVAPGDLVQQIKQEGTKLVIRSTYQQPKDGIYPIFWLGIMTEQLELASDGSEQLTNLGPYTYKTTTTQDGNRLITNWTGTVGPGSVEGEWTRVLSDDGKLMRLEMKGKCSDGRLMDATLLFHRK
jgi:hypothetical protein